MKCKHFIVAAITALSLLHLAGCGNDNHLQVITPGTETQGSVAKQMVVYEANPRCFASSGSIKAMTGRLDEIKALGTDVIWLMPIFTQGSKNAFGSPYCTYDYKAVNPNYGTLADLKDFVSKAHAKGMRVVLDIAANHTSWDHAWITEHPDWYTQSGGQIVSPSGWSDVADLNYGSAAMRSAMIENFKYWVTEAGVDGYRCDYADGVPDDFWKSVITELKKLKGSDLFMLAESNDKKYYNDGFDATYCWNFPDWTASAMSAGNITDLLDKRKKDDEGVPDGGYRMRFITNHDRASEKSPITQFKTADGALAAFVVTSMLSDCIMIYSSQEVGYSKTVNFFNNTVMDWAGNAAYTKKYKDYMAAWKATADIRSGSMKSYGVSNAAALYFSSNAGGLLVMVNLTGNALNAKVPMERQGEKVKDLLSGQSLTLGSTISLAPYGYVLLKR